MTAPVTTFGQAVTAFVNTVIAGPDTGSVLPPPPAPDWPPDGEPTPVHPGIDGRRQKTVDRIKSSSACTPVIRKLLRLDNTGDPFQPDTYVAQIRSAKENGQGQAVVAFPRRAGRSTGSTCICNARATPPRG